MLHATRKAGRIFVLKALLGLAMACPGAHGQAAPPDSALPSVSITATRDPVDKSYRKMIQGMDRFQRDHALAPDATLRFRLLPRLPQVGMEGIVLKVVGDSISLPVALAPDNSFTLVRNAQALREDAALVANRKSSSMTWRAMVTSPGLPGDARRLGDLRLECLVGMQAGLISNDPPLLAWVAKAFEDADRVCSSPRGDYLFFSERPLFSVTLHAGARSEVLPFKMLYAGGEQTPASLRYCDCQVLLDRSYYAPLWDRGWPDDTLLEFDYMDDDPAPPPAPAAQAR